MTKFKISAKVLKNILRLTFSGNYDTKGYVHFNDNINQYEIYVNDKLNMTARSIKSINNRLNALYQSSQIQLD